MDSKELALACMEFADNRKAEDVVALDVRKLTSVTDYFILCTGSSEPHLRAIINEIRDRVFEKYHVHPNCMDGMVGTSWVVLDYYDVIIHIMRADTREKYGLESFWGDAPRLTLADQAAAAAEQAKAKVVRKKTIAKASIKKVTKAKATTAKKKVSKPKTKAAKVAKVTKTKKTPKTSATKARAAKTTTRKKSSEK